MRLLTGVACAMICAARVSAQVTALDDGTFTLYVNGSRIGHEQFSIQRQTEAGRVRIVATATVIIGERRIVPWLAADTSGRPIQYKVEVRDADRLVSRADCVATGSRFAQRAITDRGRAERDVPLDARTFVLDDEVVHQYYFIGRRGAGPGRVIAPRRMGMESLTVAVGDSVDVELGNGTLPARHLTVTSGAGVVTDLWIDRMGRVLRMAVPSRGLIAVRDEPPR